MPSPRTPNQGVAWKYFNVLAKDRHGNSTCTCKLCGGGPWTGSHGRFAAHFDPEDSSICMCPHSTPEIKEEMARYQLEKEKRAEAKKRKQGVMDALAAQQTLKKQAKVSTLHNRLGKKPCKSSCDSRLAKGLSVGLPSPH